MNWEGSGRGRREEGTPGNEFHLCAVVWYESEQVVIDMFMKVLACSCVGTF